MQISRSVLWGGVAGLILGAFHGVMALAMSSEPSWWLVLLLAGYGAAAGSLVARFRAYARRAPREEYLAWMAAFTIAAVPIAIAAVVVEASWLIGVLIILIAPVVGLGCVAEWRGDLTIWAWIDRRKRKGEAAAED